MNDFKDLIVGEHAEIIGYDDAPKAYKCKLLAMGLTKGTVFILMKKAPLGDPVEIEVRGYRLSMRKHEANVLKIKTMGFRPSAVKLRGAMEPHRAVK